MQLRDYQQRAIDAVYDYFGTANGDPIIIAPTGSGKSVIIGALCREVIGTFPHQRILVLSHVRELLQQNFDKIKAFWPQAPAGLYCAGLGQKRPRDPITVASIQSVHRKAAALGWRDLIFIDECHLLSNESGTMYRKFIASMREINPRLKVIGFTATPYRLKSGMLTEGEGRLFTDIAIEITLAELLAEKHISPLVSKSSVVQADMSGVRITAGEYNAGDMERALDQEELTAAALDEVFSLVSDRRSWLVFCSGVKHAQHVRDAIRERGIICECVTGDTPKDERDAILEALKDGRIQCVTNANVLTTGFDAPNIDLIVLLRGTTSPGLYVQMLGRGMRLHRDKANCLVLDYAGNVEKHGPITHVKPPAVAKKRGPRESTPNVWTICPQCREPNPGRASECGTCGHTFEKPEGVKHGTEATDMEIMEVRDNRERGEWVDVDSVRYHRHEKDGKLPTMRAEYRCGMSRYSEWVCMAHPPGFARGKAIEWWLMRNGGEPPDNIGTAIMKAIGLTKPSRIRVAKKDRFWEILDYDFEQQDAPGTETADAGLAHSAA